MLDADVKRKYIFNCRCIAQLAICFIVSRQQLTSHSSLLFLLGDWWGLEIDFGSQGRRVIQFELLRNKSNNQITSHEEEHCVMMICPFENLDKEIASAVVVVVFSWTCFPRFNRRKVFDSIKINFQATLKDFFGRKFEINSLLLIFFSESAIKASAKRLLVSTIGRAKAIACWI